MNHPKSMFQLSGVHFRGFGGCAIGSLGAIAANILMHESHMTGVGVFFVGGC